MGHVIAVAGKGGVGKTTLCGLLIQYLCESGKKPVLAVDADANSNLNEVLGVETEITLGELREEIERAGIDSRYQIPAGVTKQDYLEMRLADAITEEDDYDLMVMGGGHGAHQPRHSAHHADSHPGKRLFQKRGTGGRENRPSGGGTEFQTTENGTDRKPCAGGQIRRRNHGRN